MILLGALKVTSHDKVFHVPLFVSAIGLIVEGIAVLIAVFYFPRNFHLPTDVNPHDRKAVHAEVKRHRQNRRYQPEATRDEATSR